MPASKEIWITGFGIITAIGNNSKECLASLQSAKTGIKKIQQLDTRHKNDFVAGEIGLSNEDLATSCGVSSELPRTTLLAIYAGQEACRSASLDKAVLDDAGLILGTTVGGMDKTEKLYHSQAPAADYIGSHPCGYTTRTVAEQLGIKGYINTISTACSSGANAIMLGARLIKQGMLDVVLAGGSDALSLFTFNGFRTLMILDQEPCRPFSAERRGLNLGEGAAFVVLESKEHAIKRDVSGFCTLSGYGNCNDAFHQTASSPDGRGPYKAMKDALESAGINPGDVDYINVHGTGTDNNDLTESIAMKNLFTNHMPSFSSTKTYTGHCLGAAGAVEAVFSAFAIMYNELYPNLRFTTSIPETEVIPETKFIKKPVNHVLSNSFGFGGCDTSLVFSKVI